MSVSNTIELVNIIYDYLIGMDDIYLSPFLTNWPTKPFITRMVSQSTLPVLTYLPELIPDANPGTERMVRVLKTATKDLSWRQTYTIQDFGAVF
jgi:hypothetical protein